MDPNITLADAHGHAGWSNGLIDRLMAIQREYEEAEARDEMLRDCCPTSPLELHDPLCGAILDAPEPDRSSPCTDENGNQVAHTPPNLRSVPNPTEDRDGRLRRP